MIISIISGFYDPIHIGHLECMERSKNIGDKLLVIVNNDRQCVLKKRKTVYAVRGKN